jgi:hypothetical protein
MEKYFLGVDLGQAKDYSALAAVERTGAGLCVRHLERLPLGTPYTEVARRVAERAQELGRPAGCCVVVDATGVGMPVVDMLRERMAGRRMYAVRITSKVKERKAGAVWRAPKGDILKVMREMLTNGGLKIAAGTEGAAALIDEMMGMRFRRKKRTGHEEFGAWGAGRHDDLTIAVALACWGVERTQESGNDWRGGIRR